MLKYCIQRLLLTVRALAKHRPVEDVFAGRQFNVCDGLYLQLFHGSKVNAASVCHEYAMRNSGQVLCMQIYSDAVVCVKCHLLNS